ncbi:MAG TPA: hypothetical protein VFB28_04825 [Terriglobales bacterium]|jgi:hypothetical protein|nr:hypothetical protein [Terriglobales bacterium]
MGLIARTTVSAASRALPKPSAHFLQYFLVLWLQMSELSDIWHAKKNSVYNVLWVLVFGFATLNILGLVLRRFEPRRTSLNFGEVLAIAVVFVSVFLLGLEMLNVFHIFPIKLTPQ